MTLPSRARMKTGALLNAPVGGSTLWRARGRLAPVRRAAPRPGRHPLGGSAHVLVSRGAVMSRGGSACVLTRRRAVSPSVHLKKEGVGPVAVGARSHPPRPGPPPLDVNQSSIVAAAAPAAHSAAARAARARLAMAGPGAAVRRPEGRTRCRVRPAPSARQHSSLQWHSD